MSIMDIASGLLGGNPTAKILGQVSEMLTQGEGVSGLVSKFQNAGLGEVVNSWVSNGENKPISAEQVGSVFGAETIQKMASAVGGTNEGIAGQLSSMLPALMNKLTPDGALPTGGISKDHIMSMGMDMIKSKLFS